MAVTSAFTTSSAPAPRAARGERVGDRAHAADRHPPFARAVADEVVQEAAVLNQRRVVHPRERPDQRVGGDHAAHRVVAEAPFQRLAERPLRQLPPEHRVGPLPQFRRSRQRLGERRRDDAGERRDLPVELVPGLVLGIGAGQRAQAVPRPLSLRPLDEQAAGAAVAEHRGIGRGGPGGEPQAEPEVRDDRLRQQRHQVGVPRQAGREPGERLRGDGRAAGVVQALEHRHRQARPGEVRRRGQPVVPAADDHHVVAVSPGQRFAHAQDPTSGAVTDLRAVALASSVR